VLRLPPFEYHRPSTVEEAVGLLAEHGDGGGGGALPVAGGTDLVPNLKHRLFEPDHLVALGGIEELRGIEEPGGDLTIGATETLSSVASHPAVRRRVPALAAAAGNVAGPQLRNMGTIGGNLCLDTRCSYYNQTPGWRKALGYCLKKDGDVCHVTRVGTSCVAAHSADTPPVLMTLGATLELAGPGGRREVPVTEFFTADGEWNQKRAPDEIVTRVRIPAQAGDVRTGYAKLRQRKSIDFPLLTVAVWARMEGDRGGEEGSEARVAEIRGVVTGLGARPRRLAGWDAIAVGEPLSDAVVEALAERAEAQCHPLENMIADPEWRKAMVPVYVRKALERLREA